MRNRLACCAAAFICGFATALTAQTTAPSVAFDDFFVNRALRVELYQTGHATDELITLNAIYQEPIWPENPKALMVPFEMGRYAVKVYDGESNRLIFVKEFDSMYGEYKTTTPAIDGVKRVFQKSVRIPEPKKPVKFVFEKRDKKLQLLPEYTTAIDPTDYHIIRETADRGDATFDIQQSGNPHDHVDLVFIPEGYAEADKEQFKADCQKMADAMFQLEPYKTLKDRFNIRGVFRASAERSADEPRQRRFTSTLLNATYNSFDLDRYLLTEENHLMHRLAAEVPYDTVVVLVNSSRYGGGSICFDYCIASAGGTTAARIFTHEFGHSFAGLADEYVGNVAYNDMYPEGIEPLEPNITRLLDPASIKWKQFLTAGVVLPTPASSPRETVGAFEGAGYVAKGMYRAQLRCMMGNGDELCVVCQNGVRRMIEYYAPGTPKKSP